jgi:hypothetical protein
MRPDTPPIACTLAPGHYLERLALIAQLSRDALLSHQRRDLVLELRYAQTAAARVRDLVRREQECCAFLEFDLQEQGDEVIQVTITAPEEARGATELLFGQFTCPSASTPACPFC